MTPIHTPVGADTLQKMGMLNLAHVGDAVYELMVRTHLARQGAVKLSDQHRGTIAFVSAPAQAEALGRIAPALTEEEGRIVRRGRNARIHGCPAGCTAAQYHAATALEALFGWLWLSGMPERAEALFAMITGDDDAA